MSRPLVCYLLHFDPPVGRARHYLGSTYLDRLNTRLLTHLRGRGAALTSAAVEGGSRFALAAVWPILNRQGEYEAKRKGSYGRRCPICKGTLTFEALAIDSPALPPPSGFQAVGWWVPVVNVKGRLKA